MDSEGEDGASDPEFATELEGLKRDGSNVLVVGDRTCHDSICDRFLGADVGDAQCRIVVTTDVDRAGRHRTGSETDDGYQLRYVPLPDDTVVDGSGGVDEPVEVADSVNGDDASSSADESAHPGIENGDASGGESTRAADLDAADPADPSTPGDSVVEDSTARSGALEAATIGILGKQFVDTIDSIESDIDLSPSELRVCVDSVSDLLEAESAEVVFRLLHAMTMRSKRSRSMGHYHYYGDRDHEDVRLIEPLFDAVVSVRDEDGTVEHRWEVRDRETETDWIPV